MAGAAVADATLVELLVRRLLKKATDLCREWYLVSQLSMIKPTEILLGGLESLHNGLSYLDQKQEMYSKDRDALLLQFWLQEVKDFAHDVQDLLDDILTTATVQGSDAAATAAHGTLMATMEKGWEKKRLLDEMHPIIERLTDLLRKKKTLIRSNETLDTNKEMLQKKNRRPETGSMQPYGFKMVGRQKEENQIIERLLGSPGTSQCHTRNVSTLGVVGMAGIGKTTLVQSIYNGDRVKHHFTYMRWLHVGDGFDPRSLINALLKDRTFAQPQPPSRETLKQLENLQERLKMRLQGERFLIVLDDVWNEDSSRWRELWVPLSYGRKGSHVVVTTQSLDVVATVQGVCIALDGLSDESCYRIIESCAFENKNNHGTIDHRKICLQVGEKVMGHPLAATLVGKSLSAADVKEGEKVLEKEVLLGESDLMACLAWSYRNLPPELKPCFQYCSLFPKGYIFDKKDLILKWKALDLLDDDHPSARRDAGSRHFDALLHRSFFQKVDDGDGKYRIHSLIHDLAKLAFSNECKAIDEPCEWSRLGKIRHVSVLHRADRRKEAEHGGDCKVERLHAYVHQKVRTVQHFGDEGCSLRALPENVCRSFRYIRVLDLRSSSITTLPRTVDKLVLLRYLNVSDCKLKSLPESLCDVHNLQTLKLSGNQDLDVLPMNMSRLVNLRYLEVPVILSGIEKLRNLQELPDFTVLRLENQNSSNIAELSDVNQLRGRLCINNLQVVQSEEDAGKARLMEKKQLDALVLNWGCDSDSQKKRLILDVGKRRSTMIIRFLRKRRQHKTVLDTWSHGDAAAAILESLKPHPALRRLEICGFNGTSCPDWISRLTHEQLAVSLEGCSLLASVQLPKNLTELRMVDCAKLQVCSLDDIGVVKLNRLVVRRCPMFESLKSTGDATDALEELTVDDWGLLEKIRTGPSSYHSLKKLCIKEVVITTGNDQNPHQHDHHPMEFTMKSLKSLEHLRFEGCKDMRSLPWEISHLTSLTELEVLDCPGVTTLPTLSSSLQHLNMHGSCLKLSNPPWPNHQAMAEVKEQGGSGGGDQKDVSSSSRCSSSSSSSNSSNSSGSMAWWLILEAIQPLKEMKHIKELQAWRSHDRRHFSMISFIRFCFMAFLTAYNCTRLINTEWWGTLVVALTASLLITIARRMFLS